MGLQEQQNVLARLFTDPEYRIAFLSDPEGIGNEAGISSDEISDIAGILPEELSFFSDSLVWKRRREVEKFLPLVRRALGDDFDRAFREFSASFNPRSVKKHLEDAIEFCKFLADSHKFGLLARDSAKFEGTKLEFLGSKKFYASCLLRHDFRAVPNDPTNVDRLELKERRTFVFWFRFGRRVRHFIR
jgi:hypothetical protein